MNRPLAKLAMVGTVGSLLLPSQTVAQLLPPSSKASHVEIMKGPELEFARGDLAIIRWTSTNPGGDDEHFAVIHYGTDPKYLSQTAKSHIRLNRGHAETIFRVRIQGLKPQTTYYYKVTSMGGDGQSDGVESSVNHFTTAAPGQVTSAHPHSE
jgi:phosphodiesterase/alkaline phosphatase D-like protein